MSRTNLPQARESGFTLIELLVVIGIVASLFVLGTINLGQAQTSASLGSITNTLLADIKNQQILAMTGEQGSTSSQQPHGIFVGSDKYTLFADATYNAGDTNNFAVNIDPDTISTTFPGNQLVFNKGDGSVAGFTSGDNTITVTGNGETKTITINRFGATAVN